MPRRLLWALCLLASSACGGDDPGPPLPVPAGAWESFEPGGDTVCSRGTPFRYFVRGGAPDKIIIDFRGGGACWNNLTCSLAGSIFAEEAGDLADLEAGIGVGGVGGIYDTSHPDHPFADWTLVHVPYCTGDIHWGDNVADYGNFSIQHKGFVNAQAALSWIYERYPAPTHILVTGCSAGAYGAILHSAYVAEHYPDAAVRVLSDSGAGIITSTFFEDSFPNWNALANLPPNVERLMKDPSELTSADLYAGISSTYPEHRFAHYSSHYDADQTFYYEAMGGTPGLWPSLMRERMEAIRTDADNFRYYVAPGPIHCITPYEFMFQRAGETPFIDWLTDFVYGDAIPDDQACEGAACDVEPLCDACDAAAEPDRYCGFCKGWPEDYVE